MPRLGVIAGLAREAACLDIFPTAERPRIAISGARAEAAAAAAERLLDEGCDALLSFGLCGGLFPDLAPGRIVLADRVLSDGGAEVRTDARWTAALSEALAAEIVPLRAPVWGSDRAVARVAAKGALFAATGCAAVDMESHVVGRAAAARGVPFLVVRAVADGAGRAVPRAALAGVAADGTARPGAVVAHMLLRPWQGPALFALARESRAAFGALGRVAALGGPLFALA